MADEINDENFKDDKENELCQTAANLQKCLKNMIKKVFNNVSDETFIEIYKKSYSEFDKKSTVDKPALSGSSMEAKKYLAQFNSMITKTISEAIDQTVLDMNKNLKQLEELKREQSGSTAFWRPPGNAFQHMIPFEYLCKIEKKKEFKSEIRKEEESLNLLKARLLRKRIKAEEHHKMLLSSITDIKNLVTKNNNLQ